MNLRHLEWLIGEVVPDQELILYELLPYTAMDADRIIRHLSALAGLDVAQANDDPERAQRVRQAFGFIVGAARVREALLKADRFDREIGRPAWRARLTELRHDRGRFVAVIGDRSACIALRWALRDLGQGVRAGRRWLHFLGDHPAVLRRAIDRALNTRLLQRNAGRTDRHDRVVFVQGVGRAYQLLTGHPLGRSLTAEGTPSGPGLRLVRVCLAPLDPQVTDDAVVWAIRRAQAKSG
jgi:hypothetical protein